MKTKDWLGVLFVVAVIALLIFAKKPETPPIVHENPVNVDTTGYIDGVAYVENISLLVLESFPVQVRAVVTGNVSDGCTVVTGVSEHREGQTFQLKVLAKRPAEAVCTQALVPFEEQVGLDVHGLLAGTYYVAAGDIMESFTLEVDNILSIETIDDLPPAGVLEVE